MERNKIKIGLKSRKVSVREPNISWHQEREEGELPSVLIDVEVGGRMLD